MQHKSAVYYIYVICTSKYVFPPLCKPTHWQIAGLCMLRGHFHSVDRTQFFTKAAILPHLIPTSAYPGNCASTTSTVCMTACVLWVSIDTHQIVHKHCGVLKTMFSVLFFWMLIHHILNFSELYPLQTRREQMGISQMLI